MNSHTVGYHCKVAPCRQGAHTRSLGRGIEEGLKIHQLLVCGHGDPYKHFGLRACWAWCCGDWCTLSTPHKLQGSQTYGAFSIFLCFRTFCHRVPFPQDSLFFPTSASHINNQNCLWPCQAHFKAAGKLTLKSTYCWFPLPFPVIRMLQ